MTTYICMCIFFMNATACIDDILIDIVRIQNTVITEIRLYPAEGPMLRASEAPFALVNIVRCSKSRTTIDASRCSQCSPTYVHQEEDEAEASQVKEHPGRRRCRSVAGSRVRCSSQT